MSILDRIDNAFNADLDCNTDKVILLAIARHADEGGFCWVSKKTLAKTTHRAECTVWRSLVRLEQAGEIVRVPMHDPTWYGVQRCNGYILTTHVKGEADEICPTKLAGAIEALQDKRFSRQRDGEDRDSATVRVATARPLEVILVSDPNEPNAGIGVSGFAASFSEGGEVDQQLQQPTDAPDAPTGNADTTTTDPTDPPALQDAVTYAWIDVFGELSDPRTVKFLASAVRGNSADEVLRALALAKGQLEKGKEIDRPAAYVKKILTTRMNEIGAGHRTAPQPPAAGHRQTDWAAVADQTNQVAPFDQAAPSDADLERIDRENQAERERRAAEQRARQEQWAAELSERAEAAEQERIAKDQAAIEREHRRLASAADAASRRQQEIAKSIAGTIEAPDQAGRMAADFLSATPDAWWQEKRLDMLTMKRHQAGKTLTTAEATAILHGGLNATTPARVRVTA